MKRFIPLTFILSLTLSSCGFLGGEDGALRDRRDSYRDADILPNMSIPATLDSYTIDELYVIPAPVNNVAEVFDAVPMPRPIDRRGREGVIIQSLAEQSWIVLDAPPDQVWARVKDYWREQQVNLDYENGSAGIMETAWVEVDDDIRTRNKFRTIVEGGLHPGYSEVYIKHISLPRSEPVPILTDWPEVSQTPEREKQILDSLSQYLADRNDIYQARSISMRAGEINAESKAKLISDPEGGQILELKINYDRAWVLVRQALENADIEIINSNRDQAVYTVKFAGTDEAESAGFLRGLFGRGGDGIGDLNFSVRLLETGSAINVVAEVLNGSAEWSSETGDDQELTAGGEQDVNASSLDAETVVALKDQLLQLINDNLS